MYRPEGLENPFHQSKDWTTLPDITTINDVAHDAWEQGVDATIEALKAKKDSQMVIVYEPDTMSYRPYLSVQVMFEKPGTLVFIPDDEPTENCEPSHHHRNNILGAN